MGGNGGPGSDVLHAGCGPGHEHGGRGQSLDDSAEALRARLRAAGWRKGWRKGRGADQTFLGPPVETGRACQAAFEASNSPMPSQWPSVARWPKIEYGTRVQGAEQKSLKASRSRKTESTGATIGVLFGK